MKLNLRSSAAILSGILLAAASTTGAAYAKPDKPEHAAQTGDGKGCLVRDGVGDYHFDANCEWHTVLKLDKAGVIQFFSYQDKGTLPEGAPRPKGADNHTTTLASCPDGVKETTTPSGQYSSWCKNGQGN